MTDHKPLVIYVEDDEEDQELCRIALEDYDLDVDLRFISDGKSALAYFEQLQSKQVAEPHPVLIMLDLNMPAINGWDLLESLRNHDSFISIPVIVFTTSTSPQDREKAFRWGANAYMVKPAGLKELGDCLYTTLRYWTHCVAS